MLIGASEGEGWRYEIVERTEGYVVRTRDVDTGAVDAREGKLFRTAAAAFAFAEMSAAFDRYASARLSREDDAGPLGELEARQAHYLDVSRRLGDDGSAAIILDAWEREGEARRRRRFH